MANKKGKEVKNKPVYERKPWIRMKTGLIIIAITSIGMFVLTAWQSIPVKGFLPGILDGLLFGGLIWVIFLGLVFFNRFIR
jgi:hypothetical protein